MSVKTSPAALPTDGSALPTDGSSIGDVGSAHLRNGPLPLKIRMPVISDKGVFYFRQRCFIYNVIKEYIFK